MFDGSTIGPDLNTRILNGLRIRLNAEMTTRQERRQDSDENDDGGVAKRHGEILPTIRPAGVGRMAGLFIPWLAVAGTCGSASSF